MPTTAIYSRVSTTAQDTASQDRDLKRWADAQDAPVVWFRDKATGTKMDRPGMDCLLADVRAGVVKKVVVWRLDRLGRTAKGLLDFFDELDRHHVALVSLRDAIDSTTPSGRLMRTVLAAVAEFETEVRSERQRAGIAAAKAAHGGKAPWGGRKKGTRIAVTVEKETAIRTMSAQQTPISEIARVVGVSRPTVYKVLGTTAK